MILRPRYITNSIPEKTLYQWDIFRNVKPTGDSDIDLDYIADLIIEAKEAIKAGEWVDISLFGINYGTDVQLLGYRKCTEEEVQEYKNQRTSEVD